MPEINSKKTVHLNPKPRPEYCNVCLGDTNHDVLYASTTRWEQVEDDEIFSVDGGDTHSLVQCRGCDAIRLVHAHWFSEDLGENGPEIRKVYYPPNVNRQKPDWLAFGLPLRQSEIGALLQEIYRAFGVNSLRLTAMGIRALVERMMIEKVGDNGSFEKNVQEFFDAGFVAGFQFKHFKETLIEAGHAAMHRNWEPTSEDIDTLLDITEALVKAIYIDPTKAEKLGQRLPKRQKSVKKKSKK